MLFQIPSDVLDSIINKSDFIYDTSMNKKNCIQELVDLGIHFYNKIQKNSVSREQMFSGAPRNCSITTVMEQCLGVSECTQRRRNARHKKDEQNKGCKKNAINGEALGDSEEGSGPKE